MWGRIAPFISAIACPLWTALADKTKTHRYIMCIVHTLATVAIVSVMGTSVAVQHLTDPAERSRLTVTLVTITSVCFAFFGVPVGPLVDGGVLKILGRNKDQYGKMNIFVQRENIYLQSWLHIRQAAHVWLNFFWSSIIACGIYH